MPATASSRAPGAAIGRLSAPPDAADERWRAGLVALIAALFVSGVIGRTVHARQTRRRPAGRPMPASAFPRSIIAGNRRTPAANHPGGAGHAARPVDLRRRSAAARAPLMALDWIASADVRAPLSRRHLRHAGRKAALRAVADRPTRAICGGRALRRGHHHPGRASNSALCPSWSAPARPRPPPIWSMRCTAHRAIAARIARLCSASRSGAGT